MSAAAWELYIGCVLAGSALGTLSVWFVAWLVGRPR